MATQSGSKEPIAVYCSECQAHHYETIICEFRHILGGWVPTRSNVADRSEGYWRIHCRRRRHPKLDIPMDGRLEHFLDEWDAASHLPEFADVDSREMHTETLKRGIDLTEPRPERRALAA